LLVEIQKLLKHNIESYRPSNKTELIDKFDKFRIEILMKFFGSYAYDTDYNMNGYPQYFVSYMVGWIEHKFKNENHSINAIVDYFNMIESIGSFNSTTINILITNLLTNVFEINTISFTLVSDDVIQLLTRMQKLNISLVKFLRYLIINRHNSATLSTTYLWNKIMSYQNRGEVSISNFIKHTSNLADINTFINWTDGDGLDELDLFYLSYELIT
jgi:hypothetical protein